jgi:uncharacterized membrane protein YhiD involved in acid resistance
MLLKDLQSVFNFSVTSGQVFSNLIVSLICGLAISLFYRWTYRGPNYSRSFVNSLIVLSMITSIVIVVIGNNLARAFGLVGAMSIIRFRTPIKDAHDIVFIFFALTVGLAAGVGLYKVAITGTLFVGFVMLLLNTFNYGTYRRKEYLLQFSYKVESDGDPPYLAVLKKYCKEHKLINVRSMGSKKLIELSFYIGLKDELKGNRFVEEFNNLANIQNVNLFFDSDHEV